MHTGFADEGGKLDLESGSFEDEFENILLEDGDTISLEDGFHKQVTQYYLKVTLMLRWEVLDE